jgi:hypothetical protein
MSQFVLERVIRERGVIVVLVAAAKQLILMLADIIEANCYSEDLIQFRNLPCF